MILVGSDLKSSPLLFTPVRCVLSAVSCPLCPVSRSNIQRAGGPIFKEAPPIYDLYAVSVSQAVKCLLSPSSCVIVGVSC